ncbi:MAG: hypothetical protein ABIO70_30570 [Pseudomonadota bacterium]
MPVLPWSELPSLAPVAALYGATPEALRAEAATFPAAVRGVALVAGTEVLAAALWVRSGPPDLPRLARLALAPEQPAAVALDLVAWAEAQPGAGRGQGVSLRQAPGVGALLEARGYRLDERYLRLIQAAEPLPPGPLPAGFAERALSAVGVPAFLAMSNAAFASIPGALPLTADDWRALAESAAFREDCLCVLVDGAGPVGFARGELLDDEGLVEAVGLVERGRGRGLGRWLLSAGLRPQPKVIAPARAASFWGGEDASPRTADASPSPRPIGARACGA